MSQQEQLDQRRYYGVLWFLVGFVTWQGPRVVRGFWPEALSSQPLNFVVLGISLLGWGLWTYHLVRLLLLKRSLSDAERKRLNDERVRQTRRQSFALGCWAMLATAGGLLIAPDRLTASVAANVILFVGVAAVLGAFLWYEADSALPFSDGNIPAVTSE